MRSTTPTAKPTRSNSPGSMRSGCSDISPPSSAHPASHAPARDTGDDLVDHLGDELADRDVVEEEERLGALHRDVVDRHRDEVDADGVVAAVRRAMSDFVPTPSVDETSSGCSKGWASNANRPPKPPMSPMTSGRNVERTCCLMSSTAFSPAAMSTPASAIGQRSVGAPAPAPSRVAGAWRRASSSSTSLASERGTGTG